MAVPVTALYGAIHGVFNVLLAANVSRVRGKSQTFLGNGDSNELLLAIRRHGNHAEYVALFLVLLACAELSGGAARVLYGVGALFTLARVLHVVGVGFTPSPLRIFGTLFTWISIATAGVYGAIVATH